MGTQLTTVRAFQQTTLPLTMFSWWIANHRFKVVLLFHAIQLYNTLTIFIIIAQNITQYNTTQKASEDTEANITSS